MFDVVACGFPAAPLSGLPAHRRVPSLPSTSAPDFYDRALDLLMPRLEGDADATVLLMHDGRPASEHPLRVLRSMLRTSRVLPVGVRIPVSGLSALTSLCATFGAGGLTPGTVVSAMPQLRAMVIVQAVTTTVSDLDFPEIKMRHQLTSWMPGTRIPLRFGDRLLIGHAAVDTRMPTPHVDILRFGQSELETKLGSIAGVAPREQLALTIPATVGEDWWGTKRYFERCLVPTELDPIAEWMQSTQWRRCPQCADSIYASCSFCSAQEVLA